VKYLEHSNRRINSEFEPIRSSIELMVDFHVGGLQNMRHRAEVVIEPMTTMGPRVA